MTDPIVPSSGEECKGQIKSYFLCSTYSMRQGKLLKESKGERNPLVKQYTPMFCRCGLAGSGLTIILWWMMLVTLIIALWLTSMSQFTGSVIAALLLLIICCQTLAWSSGLTSHKLTSGCRQGMWMLLVKERANGGICACEEDDSGV